MFEAALIDAIDRINSPPAIIRSFVDMGDMNETPAQFAKRVGANLDEAEKGLSAWLQQGAVVRGQLAEVFQKAMAEGVDPGTFLPKLDERIAQVELAAVRAAQESDELATRMRKQKRLAKALGGGVAEVFASISDRMLSIMERELEDRGDFVLLMKAWRAHFEAAPSQPSFDDPKKLERHLKAMLVA